MNYKKHRIELIAAVAANGAIGHNNQLLCRLPKDMRRFAKTTTGCPVVMGRKTHESIGKVLPGRRNIVVTHDRAYQSPFGQVDVMSVEDVLALSLAGPQSEPIFVIGGEQIYREFLPYARILHITNILAPLLGDAYFPEVNEAEWLHIRQAHHTPDAEHRFAFDFDVYSRH